MPYRPRVGASGEVVYWRQLLSHYKLGAKQKSHLSGSSTVVSVFL